MFCAFQFKSLGTTVAQLVFSCCQECPRKRLIQAIIELETKMNRKSLIKTIFTYVSKDKYNCMVILFQMMVFYYNKTGSCPDPSMPIFNEIEEVAFYLIKLAEDNALNMDIILNWTTNDGQTLFSRASSYCESLAIELLKRNVIVTTVDDLFLTPSFRVSYIIGLYNLISG